MPFFPITFLSSFTESAGPTRRYVLDGRLDGHRNGVYALSACGNGTLLASGGMLRTNLSYVISFQQGKVVFAFMIFERCERSDRLFIQMHLYAMSQHSSGSQARKTLGRYYVLVMCAEMSQCGAKMFDS